MSKIFSIFIYGHRRNEQQKESDISKSIKRVNPVSANFKKWSNTLKQFVGKLPTNCLSVFGHFMGLALKGLNFEGIIKMNLTFMAMALRKLRFNNSQMI